MTTVMEIISWDGHSFSSAVGWVVEVPMPYQGGPKGKRGKRREKFRLERVWPLWR